MALNLSAADIQKIWNNSSVDRAIQTSRLDYYAGDQDICDETEERFDGQDRNLVVTNWVKYVVNKHVGFILNKPVKYTAREGQDENALTGLDEVYRYNYLLATDVEHMKNAISAGYGVEVHAFDGEQVTIEDHAPDNWAFLEDADGKVLAAVYRATLPTGTYWAGAILDAPLDVYTCYTETEIIKLEGERRAETTAIAGVDATIDGVADNSLKELNRVAHNYGRVPVIRFGINKDLVPFIDSAFKTQQDVFNEVRSRNADDVEYNVDSLLKLKGYDPDAMTEKDSDGKTYAEKMRQTRLLPLHENGDAEFLTKGNEYPKVEFDLKLTRDAVHMMGAVADTESIAGATGSASGIALKLKLQPQIDQAGVFTAYFEKALRERIDLLNIIWGIKGKPTLEQYDVGFSLQIPVNEQEIWQGITYLYDLLAREDLLKLIPSVEDPAAAAEAKQKEMDAEAPTPDPLAMRNERNIGTTEPEEETTNA